MKRSEMVNIITRELAVTAVEGRESWVANHILKICEDKGMLPPDTGGVFGWNEGYIEPPKWAPEE